MGDADQNTERMRSGSTSDTGSDPTAEQTRRIVQGDLSVSGDSTSAWSDASTRRTTMPPESDSERTQTITPVSAESDAETTQSIPRVPNSFAAPAAPTAFGAPVADFAADRDQKKRGGLARGGVIAGIAAGLLALLYIGDIAFTSGQVPRGTVVADVEIGGMQPAAAEKKLRERVGPTLENPVRLEAGDSKTAILPQKAGLTMDWAATIDKAGTQSWNPFTRISSLFTTQDVTPVSHGDRAQVTAALEEAKPQLDRAPAEGTIRFDGGKPVAVDPVVGRTVDIAGATDRVLSDWASGKPVKLPATDQPVSTTKAGVQKAMTEVAEPAVAAPVVVHGEGMDAQVSPEAVAEALKFEPDGNGGLKSRIDVPAVIGAVEPQLRGSIKPGKDAEIKLEGDRPVVHPSVDGRGVDWHKSFEKLGEVLKKPEGKRDVRALYAQQPAKFTTDQANQLGIKEVVSEFSTGGFEPASGVNIRRTAEQVNGAIIKPGESFSLNGHTGPRGIPQGYVESGIIEDGRPSKAVGGGISQFATTLYNASYFAGVKDVEHKEHSYYISRYPMGREATVFQAPDGRSVIDVKFKNTTRSGIMITTAWTPSSITVRFWSTKQFDVTSQTSPKSEPTPPQEKVVPPGQPCSPSTGQPGFTVFDTRTLRDIGTGQVMTEKPSKTVYNPHPNIHCPPPPPAPPAP